MINLYANIGVGHENDWDCIYSRVVAAAQCNVDAIIMTKSTPAFIIPENKKYVSMESKWGSLPYIEVAKRSELCSKNVKKLLDLKEQIGIPLIWCITDNESGDWVKQFDPDAQSVKIHYDSSNDLEVVRFAKDNFRDVMYYANGDHVDEIYAMYPRGVEIKKHVKLFHTPSKFPAQVEESKLGNIDLINEKYQHAQIGYEGRCPDIYPDCAVVLKKVDYIEKYLGDEEPFNDAVLTHQKFYDFFVNMNQLEIAHE